MNAIEIKDLKKTYDKTEALKGISFYVKQGDFFGFIGPNGAGKTTTIHSIMGLLRYQGRITVAGLDVEKDYVAVRRKLGFSPQEENFDQFLTTEQTLTFTAGYFGLRKKERKRQADKWLKEFGLEEHRKKYVRSLSGGMKRRLLIARALVHKPEIVILDEPTAGMDVALRRNFWELLTKINAEGTTIILTSHYIEEVEKLCNNICIMDRGKLMAMDKKETIMQDLSNQELQLKTSKPIPAKIVQRKGFIIEKNGTLTKIIGRGIRQKAKSIIDTVEKAGITVEEINMVKESLEQVFLRLTKKKK